MTDTLSKRLSDSILPALKQDLGINNVHELPRLEKISVNIGLGEIKGNEPLQKSIEESLALITGQKPVKTKSKRAIAGFKLREGDVVGYRVTLRGKRMYDFYDRLVTYVFPRIRDFQGFSANSFDRQGNYSFGLKDQLVFPELPYQSNASSWGMQITCVTTSHNKEHNRALLTAMGFPFSKK